MLLLLRRASRALEGCPSERQHFFGVGRENPEELTQTWFTNENASCQVQGKYGVLLTTKDTVKIPLKCNKLEISQAGS